MYFYLDQANMFSMWIMMENRKDHIILDQAARDTESIIWIRTI